MNILAGLESFLFIISSVLLFPVVTALVLITCWVVVFFGWFLREYLDRRQGRFVSLERYRTALAKELEATTDKANLDIALERLLQAAELGLIKSLDKIRFVIRVGPALGLMGTLIPMGISLSAMAQGDMPKMAGSMVTAFTTVVVGLASSVVAYVMSLVKEKWVRADMREMEFMTEGMLRSAGQHREIPREEAADELS
ncbi:MotA/TolQ/ExbB proton channel family protein [Pelobacter propionicus]|uniref:Outer membrane transport energization protein ExbB n=1 Tax=Pelobacter propionicus (strain DSM 2379 / NBRC 103807 / OttBd1) TaxID=338966 RepID=A1AND5_PELPD|nr:MotA/TolQ/ExbB proton channel family protein [Pelobacter propionicus]ABK98855.1 outer membrane transport energization protein ExbB [Pelobacter propionicus DSM 2379]